jgi:hypothetical protein
MGRRYLRVVHALENVMGGAFSLVERFTVLELARFYTEK